MSEEHGKKNELVLSEKINGTPPNRLHKARTWVNQSDLEGGMAIRDQFQAEGIPAPELIQRRRHERKTDDRAPFVITMGLGFTDEASETIEKRCDAWMRIVRSEEWGDVTCVYKDIMSAPDVIRRIDGMGLEIKDEIKVKKRIGCLRS